MRHIVLMAVLTLLFLPVLAAEPVNVSGALGEVWFRIPANTDQGLWTWGGSPNYYISYNEDYYNHTYNGGYYYYYPYNEGYYYYYPYNGGYYYYYPYGYTIYIDPYT